MNMPKISVIVPVYNVGNYLYECLDSIANQTIIEDIEVIMVNDGSTDSSGHIMNRYSGEYDNFHSYHKENEGLAMTRNYGMQYANGEYIFFFDADDYIPPNSLEKLYSLAKKYDHDIVTGNFSRFNENFIWREEIMDTIFGGIDEDIESTHFREYPNLSWDVPSWNKIFKRQFLEKHDILFPNENVMFEDNLFLMKSHYLADSIGIIHDDIQYWRLRPQSITQKRMDEKLFDDRIKMIHSVHDFMEKNIVESDVKDMIYHKFINMDLLTMFQDLIDSPDISDRIIDEIIEIIKFIPENVIDGCSTYRRLLLKMMENRNLEDMTYIRRNYLRLIRHSPEDIFENIGEEYRQYVNFKQDMKIEEFITKVSNIKLEGENLVLTSNIFLQFCPDYDFNVTAKLIKDDGNEHELTINDKMDIILPISLLDDDMSRVKVELSHNDIHREAFLKFEKNMSIRFGNHCIDTYSGYGKQLNLMKRKISEKKLSIDEITYGDNEIILKGRCTDSFDLKLQNLITFEKIDLDVEVTSDDKFTSRINFNDLINAPVKKWKLKSNLILKNMKKIIYMKQYKINFRNKSGEVLVDLQLFDKNKELNKLNDELSNIQSKNSKLLKENKKLKNRINEYKSRKVVRFVDKVKRIL